MGSVRVNVAISIGVVAPGLDRALGSGFGGWG